MSRGAVLLRFGFGVAAAVGGTAVAAPDSLQIAYLMPTRLARCVYTAGMMVADYKTSLKGAEGDARTAALMQCHERGAQRMLGLCFANGGIYIKLGQHIGQLDHLLPSAYVTTMRDHLLDKCPTSSYEEVAGIIQADLGARPEQLFATFEPKPIASASLAQVHVATSHDGTKLAVKVQHAGLRESSTADIATIEVLVHAVKRIFPDFDYEWLVDEVKANLPLELDFLNEASNAAACKANLASKRSRVGTRVHVPEMIPALTSQRVLTMEFIGDAASPAVGAADAAAVQAMGFRPAELAALISETFNEMIFVHGHVHCDPHAANLMVRRGKDGRMQLVLLDHGLYKELDDGFRLEYASLWRALVLADEAGIRRHCRAMHTGDEGVRLFTTMLTQRPWEQVIDANSDHLYIVNSDSHREKLQRLAAEYATEISAMLLNIPRPLLLLLKTNDCLRAVDLALGQPINTFVITARECARALAEERHRVAAGDGPLASARPGSSGGDGGAPGSSGLYRQVRLLPARLANAWDAFGIEARITGMKAAAVWAAWACGQGGGQGARERAAARARDAREWDSSHKAAIAGVAA